MSTGAKTVILVAGFGLIVTMCSCRMNHVASGKVSTDNKVTAEVVIRHPLCERVDFSPEQALRCIELSNKLELDIKAGDDTSKTIAAIQDLVDTAEGNEDTGAEDETATKATNIMGVI